MRIPALFAICAGLASAQSIDGRLSLCKLSGVKPCTLFGVFFEYGRTGRAYGRGPKSAPLIDFTCSNLTWKMTGR